MKKEKKMTEIIKLKSGRKEKSSIIKEITTLRWIMGLE